MSEREKKQRYRIHHIEGVGDIRLPRPPDPPYTRPSDSGKLPEYRDIAPLRTGDKIVYAFLIAVGLGHVVRWIVRAAS